MSILLVKNLSVSFKGESGWTQAIDSVSFSVKPGEKIAIVGESGSGKSVTSLAIMGLLPQSNSRIDEGEIVFDDSSLLSLSEEERRLLRGREMAMVFQEPMTSLNPLLTCGDQVEEVLSLQTGGSNVELRDRVLELFEKVKLPRAEDMLEQYPHELSGGQKQRVMIAMAMACSPKLLIADEPTTALDVTVQGEILQLIDELVKEHDMACVFITHDLGLVKQFSDEVLVMYKGSVVEQGRTEDVFLNPRQLYTKGLIACKPSLTTNSFRLPTVLDYIEEKEVFVESVQKEKKYDEVILSVENVSVEYITEKSFLGATISSVKAVNDISFELKKGETLGLVGESGCGKTTLGRAILGLEEIVSGRIMFNETSVHLLSSAQKREYWKKAQIIFQDPYSSLNPRLTIGSAIVEVMSIHGILDTYEKRKNETIRLLEVVGLQADHFQRFPHEFSGGQRQRVCIARTLAMKPELIICDESVSALDVSVQAQVLNLLNDLKEEFQLTYVFISHDLSVVKYMSDRILVMKNGELVEIGNSNDIYKSPQEEYTKELLNAIPDA